MGWNIGWVFWGGAAFLLVIINLIRTLLGKQRGWQILLFSSLSCGAVTVLKEYQMVAQWLRWGNLSAVQGVVPTLANTLQTAVWVGILLNLAGPGGGEAAADGKVRENQVLTSSLGNVAQNDLPSFMNYIDAHRDEIKDDIRMMEKEYNVDPLIYAKDATNRIAKMNPSNLFSSLIPESSLLRNYSTMTSIFRQFEPENLERDTELLAGRYPERYNELIVVLNNPGEISELITYSLGLHDSEDLNEIIAKIMSGENVSIKNEPLELSYEDIMNVDLRLIAATDLYKYNSKYKVYEDMSTDEEYMKRIFNDGEKLEIVGIAAMDSEMMASGSGIAYLPSLVTHIVDKSSQSEIVKKQLENPDIDIFSNTKFGDESNDYSFAFSDLVSVDEAALTKAFGVSIDQNTIADKTREYMDQISNEISADVSPTKNALIEKFKELASGLYDTIMKNDGMFMKADIPSVVEEYIKTQDFAKMEEMYYLPKDKFAEMYTGLLNGLLNMYTEAYAAGMSAVGMTFDPETMPVVINQQLYEQMLETYLGMVKIDAVFESVAIPITEINMKKEVLTKVGELSSYLSSSFASAFNVDKDAIVGAFHLNFSEDELQRVVSAMFTNTKTTLVTNLTRLGYQSLDDPTGLSFYFWSFDGKTRFIEFLDHYNDLMREMKKDDKVIDYTDTTGVLMSSVKTIVDAVSYVLIAFVSISLIVSSIMIGVITYISVYERTKEIGILRAIGASKHNISSIFNAETFIIGFLSGLFGVVISYLLIPIINMILHHFTGDIPLSAFLDPKMALFLIALSVVLTLIGGLIPARSASKKDPVEALRTE